MSVDEWMGEIQAFLSERIKDAPNEECRAFVSELWDRTADDDAPGDGAK